MGNCVHGFISCIKIKSVSTDDMDTQLLDIDNKTSTLDHTVKEISIDDVDKSTNTYKTKPQRVDRKNEGAVSNNDMFNLAKTEPDGFDDKNTQIVSSYIVMQHCTILTLTTSIFLATKVNNENQYLW